MSKIVVKKADSLTTEINGKRWNAFSESILAAYPILHGKILKKIKD